MRFCTLVPLALVLLPTACVERKLFIRSDPPGASISLNREAPLAAKTPAEVPFSFYGTYAVRLTLPGHRDLEATAEVDPPWWSWPPFDFFAEILWPATIREHREFSYTLEPLPPVRGIEESRKRNREVIERGERMRREVGEEER